MTPHRMHRSTCQDEIDPSVLMDYWLAMLSSEEEDRVEHHLMACDACGDRLREVMALADSLRDVARSGSLQVVVAEPLLRRAVEEGRQLREYSSRSGEAIQCTVSNDDDFLVARLAADLTTAARVDLSWCDAAGREHQRMADIPVRADAGEVLCQQSIAWAKASPTATMIARLLTVDEHGYTRVLGEYTFQHTRTIPGPPGWQLP